MTCNQCNKDFEAQRATAKYCSPKCRVSASRSVTGLSVTTDKTVSVTTSSVPSTDFTRAMVEANRAKGETFTPNWYRLGYESRDECVSVVLT